MCSMWLSMIWVLPVVTLLIFLSESVVFFTIVSLISNWVVE